MRVSYHSIVCTINLSTYYLSLIPTYTANTGSPTHSTHTQHTRIQPVQTGIELIQQIQEVLSTPVISIPDKILFKFQKSDEAAAHNAEILKRFNYNISTAIEAQKDAQVNYGSEFRAHQVLKKVFRLHPHWPKQKEILCHGASFPLQPISNELCQEDLKFHKQQGNLKSGTKLKPILDKIIKEDIERGFALPLPMDILDSLPNASLVPLGC
jgi:hypothetical protein